jgi:methionyl-tRNA formyltransferase
VGKIYPLLSRLTGHTLKRVATKAGIPHLSATTLDEETIEWLSSHQNDYIINGSNNILGNSMLSLPKVGVLNFHGAPLPAFRGAANYVWVLIEQLQATNLTLHYVDKGIDTGEVIKAGPDVPIEAGDSVYQVYKKVRRSAEDRSFSTSSK